MTPTIIMLDKILTEMYWSRQYLSLDPKKFARPTLTPITLKSVFRRYVAHFNLALLLAFSLWSL